MANRNEEKGEEHMREDGMEYTGENTGTDGSEPKNEQGRSRKTGKAQRSTAGWSC